MNDFLPLLAAPSSLLLGSVRVRTKSAAELQQHQGNISCIFQDILERVALCFIGLFSVYFVTRSKLRFVLTLVFPLPLWA